MQHKNKTTVFKKNVGKIFKRIREENNNSSRSQFAREYEFDRGNLSKMENGQISCSLITAWKICEALGVKFSDFAKALEDELGEDFKLIDE